MPLVNNAEAKAISMAHEIPSVVGPPTALFGTLGRVGADDGQDGRHDICRDRAGYRY